MIMITLASQVEQQRSIMKGMAGNLSYRKWIERIAFGFMWLAGLIALAMLVWVIGYVLLQGGKVINLEFLTTKPSGGASGDGGMSTTVVTTFYLVILTLVIAAPLGIGGAVYLVEYAHEMSINNRIMAFFIRLARHGIEILAGVPSIIFGLFGFALFVSYMKLKFSLISAGLSGAALILPIIIRTSEEALLAVPQSYREASLGLGANKWQTIIEVILPAAMPGVITGVILGVGRVIAETAVFWVTLGGSFNMPTSLFSSGRTMALHVYMLASETRAFDKAMGTAAILIITIVLLNLSINYFSRTLSDKAMGRRV
jgi:phosphate transport system permease protein